MNARIRAMARQAGLGRWLFKVAWDPAKPWGYGFWAGCRFLFGQHGMRRAAERLATLPSLAGEPVLAPTFLTGTAFWHQTAFCLHSLAMVCGGRLAPRIYDDGTLRARETACLRRIAPHARIVHPMEAHSALEQHLPRERFPKLRATRDRIPMMRKFVDLRVASRDWQLYLDSDMLFFRRPEFLIACGRERMACHMVDVADGYVLPPEELARLAGRPVPLRVNAGIVALHDGELDWPALEELCAAQPPEIREHRLFEQTLTAILLTRAGALPAPPEEYAMVAACDGSRPPSAVMAHYIIRGKYPYQTREWRDYCQELPRANDLPTQS